MTSIFNFLLIAGAIQGFVFNIATFWSRKKVERPVLFLNLFVFVLSMNNLQSWLIDNGYVSKSFLLQQIIVPFYVLIVPMFYAFVRTYLGIQEKKWSFLKYSIVLFFSELSARSVVIMLTYREVITIESIEVYNLIEDALTLGYSLFIFYKAASLIYNYEKLYTPILSFDDLNWLKRFIKLGGAVMMLWLVSVLLNTFSESIRPPYSYYPLRLGSSILIYWIGYQGFFRYVILKDRIEIRKGLRKVTISPENHRPNTNKRKKEENGFGEVHNHVVNERKYLDPYFSLEKLAGELHMGTTKLSRVINRNSGHNFSDYLNVLRVSEAKTILRDDVYSSYTIVAIGLECGFNSKSTFYNAFKKFTGLTPTQYRQQTSSKSE